MMGFIFFIRRDNIRYIAHYKQITGIALQGITGVKLWSKAGWTSTTRHDAAYIELPNGAKFVLVTFTTDHANEREIIPTVAKVVLDGMKSVK